ncbi:hypothetical protein AC579_2096 [Pseudocercospora musae]|uniref:Heterokaryon incompatibility domain-containing protein n=1 Tax=Pseudocercospora musae TaxID=113226 RepID=A0A139ICW4_9PEZI|nr:hypothetical protein AC579_2096 [Pseudocercospora musae]
MGRGHMTASSYLNLFHDRAYVYEPLPNPRAQIRLLKISYQGQYPWQSSNASRFDWGKLLCNLTVHDIDSCPEYVAISYTWGETEQSRSIELDNKLHRIFRNCFDVLQLAHYHYKDWLIWIDAICIDQENSIERGDQVRLMGKIFALGKEVAACLGPSGQDADLVLGVLASMSSGQCRAISDSERTLVSRFKDRAYWTRLWIVQECLSAEYLRFICGPHKVKATDLEWIVDNSQPLGLTQTWMHDLLDTCLFQDDSEGEWGLSDLLYRFSDRHCADPRDCIYGLMSVLPGTEVTEIEVDYGIALPLLARSVMLALPDWNPIMHSWSVRACPSDAIEAMLYALGLVPYGMSCTKVAFSLCGTVEDIERLSRKYDREHAFGPDAGFPIYELAIRRLVELETLSGKRLIDAHW